MSFNKLKFGSTIGIIGGGQLGKMMAQSAQKWALRLLSLIQRRQSMSLCCTSIYSC